MKQKLYRLLVPQYVKDKLYQMSVRQYLLEEARRREIVEQELPRVELSPIYMQRLKVVATINELIRNMQYNAVVAEVGVGRGMLSERLLVITNPRKLFLLDNWTSANYQDGLLEIIRNKFMAEIQSGVVEVYAGDPNIELEKISDGTLDWIYLKSDNSYQNTATLLDISRKKVTTGGRIVGCNYALGNWISHQRFGVIEAVNEFCKRHGWEMIYLTNERDRMISYALEPLSIDTKMSDYR